MVAKLTHVAVFPLEGARPELDAPSRGTGIAS